ncbi:MAG: ABC-F type ribosomal protection protein [Methylobacteriaceae bacterium]|nr:ABC-F type ribosomal protection protein [Methylobacteriaceae bacterium]
MSAIIVSKLSFAYDGGNDFVFQNVDAHIDTAWKLGLIGRNGRGKTTFLRLLMGALPADGAVSASTAFGFFPQEAPAGLSARQVLAVVAPEAPSWRLERELSLLAVAEEALEQPFDTLSGGERTKVLLAALFTDDSRFPLIDEPTNHLDEHCRRLVSAYLKRKDGFILVSHDRRFLDGCVDHIMALNKTGIELQSGTFSSWQRNFDARNRFEAEQNRRLEKDIDRLRRAAERTARWSDRVENTKYGVAASGLKPDKGFVGHKAAKMMKRSLAIDSRRQQAIGEKSRLLRDVESVEDLKLAPLAFHSRRLVDFDAVSLFYGEKQVCRDITFTVEQGDRLALVGGNGSGKSTILKRILGDAVAFTGRIVRPEQLRVSHVPQETAHLTGRPDAYARACGISETLFKTVLRKLDFSRALFDADMSGYSAGQKKKVLIARSLCEPAHLYLWDEPLNYIDVFSRMQIEDLLRSFKPTMIFVEHDAAFRAAVATKELALPAEHA